MKIQDLPIDSIPTQYIPCDAAPYSKTTGPIVSKMPEIEKIRQLAAEEKECLDLQKKFSKSAAFEDFNRKLAAATATMDPELILAAGSESDFAARYEAGSRGLSEKIRRIHKSAFPAVEAVTARVIEELIKMRETAASDFAQVFSSRGLPVPCDASIRDPFTRAIQNALENLRREQEKFLFGMQLGKFLAIVGA
jgi:hypothetical protein